MPTSSKVVLDEDVFLKFYFLCMMQLNDLAVFESVSEVRMGLVSFSMLYVYEAVGLRALTN